MTGITFMHEHLRIDLSQGKGDVDCLLDEYDLLLSEFKDLKAKGLARMVDVSCRGLGRDYAWLDRVEAETGLQILISTGFYKEPFLPEMAHEKSVKEIAQLFMDDIEKGCEQSDRKAKLIAEIGTSHNVMNEMEKKVFEASAMAHDKTNVPISTHTTLGSLGFFQVQFLMNLGVLPDKIIIGHLDLANDYDEILRVLDKGAYVEFDTIGKLKYLPDETRVDFIKRACARGYEKQLLLSMDITRRSHLKENGGVGYAYFFDDFLPKLQNAGISEEAINAMLVKNPARLLP